MHAARQLAGTATIVFLGLALSCGRGDGSLPPAPDQHAAALVLHVWDADCVGQPGSLDVRTRHGAGDEIIAQICTSRARGLKALYFDIAYDMLQLTPVSGEFSAALAGGGQLLQLAVLDEPGKAYLGAVRARYSEQAGFSGDGVLAELRFAPADLGMSAATASAKWASAVPKSAASKAALWFDESSSTLNWLNAVQGDYDQNGEVNISDLTPLGLFFGQKSTSAGVPFCEVDVRSIVDGDSNGEINIVDITPIGANYGASAIGGYAIYAAPTANGYPSANDEPTHIPLLDVQLMPGMTPQGQRLRYSYTLTNPTPNDVYWVRPLDGFNNPGTPSNIAGGNPAQRTTLDIFSHFGVPGSGTAADPYQVLAGKKRLLNLSDPAFNDVSTSPDSLYHISSDSLSYISIDNAWMTIPDPLASSFSGYFTVWATYQNLEARNRLYFRAVESYMIPTARLTADTRLGQAPLTVNFDAGTSTTPNGSIVKYEFEFTGDPYNPVWIDGGLIPQQQYTYTTALDYSAQLRVTDDQGLKGTTQIAVTVYDWRIDTVDAGQPPANVVGKYCSLALVASQPGVSYYDETAGQLCYAYYDGAAWHATIVDQSGNAGLWTSLVELDDRPAIAYYDQQNDDVKYARAATAAPAGLADWASHSIDGPDGVGEGISLCVKRLPAAGMFVPGIAYVNATDNTVNFAQAKIPGPTSAADWAIYAVAPADDFSRPTLAYLYDASLYPNEVYYPAIAYTDNNNFDLMYAQAMAPDLAGGAAWAISSVDDGSTTSAGAFLYFVSSQGPYISSYDSTSGSLRLSNSGLSIPDAAGTWSSQTVAGVTPMSGDYSSMFRGYAGLVIVYRNVTNSVLEVVRGDAYTMPPTSWLQYSVDLSPGVGEYCSVAEMNGPTFGVAYFDSTNGNLKYAQHNYIW